MAQEGFPRPYGESHGLPVDPSVLDEVLYGGQGSTSVVDGSQPDGYTPFAVPDAVSSPETQAGGSMKPPEDGVRTLVGSDGESQGRRLTIVREDGSEVTLEILDD